MMLDMFFTSEYDQKVIIRHNNNDYTVKELKELIAGNIQYIKELSHNVVITPDDNFGFIINFFASLFTNKNIYLISDTQKLNNFNISYSLLKNNNFQKSSNLEFNTINPNNPTIIFYTSGTTGEPQCIKKSLHNLISEGYDAIQELNLPKQNFTIKSTTTMCHLFGMTFSFIVPLLNGYIIDTDKVLYPQDININHCFLVSTPTFLDTIKKYSLNFCCTPQIIISSGAKLQNDTFKYFENTTKIIEIYGSTETGIIAYREHYNDELVKFPNVHIENNNVISSNYIWNNKVQIKDILKISGIHISVTGRTDKLLKIYEKRVSASAIESSLNKTKYINKAYCFKFGDKLATICSLTDIGKIFILDNGIIELEKFLKKELKEISEIVPQKWRFIDEIPYGITGKIDKKRVEHLFDTNFSYPIILDKEVEVNKIVCRLFFYKNCNFYKGHFPNFPITPGVTQLYLANDFANYYFNKTTTAGQIKRIKFSNIIYPNSVIYLVLEKNDKYIEYIYKDENKIYSSGVFSLENIFSKEK